jgi:hypothetical protein
VFALPTKEHGGACCISLNLPLDPAVNLKVDAAALSVGRGASHDWSSSAFAAAMVSASALLSECKSTVTIASLMWSLSLTKSGAVEGS